MKKDARYAQFTQKLMNAFWKRMRATRNLLKHSITRNRFKIFRFSTLWAILIFLHFKYFKHFGHQTLFLIKNVRSTIFQILSALLTQKHKTTIMHKQIIKLIIFNIKKITNLIDSKFSKSCYFIYTCYNYLCIFM